MLVETTFNPNEPLTQEEMEMLEKAEKMTPVFDEDSPELTEEELQEFKRVNRLERNKQTVTLRLSPQALKKAKSLGKGYTSVLSRILENALENSDTIKNYL